MNTKRQVFYSFHYKGDAWRAGKVRNIGVVEGNKQASDNDWEEIKRGGDTAIKKWIAEQMNYRSCTVVLVGQDTANRKWINYEINKSLEKGMGVVGIYIHGLKDQNGETSPKGSNPFDYAGSGCECYSPSGYDSQDRYQWIKENLAEIIENAIYKREEY